jgi:hypothetical protein
VDFKSRPYSFLFDAQFKGAFGQLSTQMLHFRQSPRLAIPIGSFKDTGWVKVARRDSRT